MALVAESQIRALVDAHGPVRAVDIIEHRQRGAIAKHQVHAAGLSVGQLRHRADGGRWDRRLPGVLVNPTVEVAHDTNMHAALLWTGEGGAVAGRSACARYGIGSAPTSPEIAVPYAFGGRTNLVALHRYTDRAALMVRRVQGLPVVGPECALLGAAAVVDAPRFELLFERARREGLTTGPALRRYVERHGGRGRAGTAVVRRTLALLGDDAPAESELEVLTTQLMRTDPRVPRPTRQHELVWNGRRFRFDYAWIPQRVILETNGRKWHADPNDWERDQHKWSVPGSCRYRLVLATWKKITETPATFLAELTAALGVA